MYLFYYKHEKIIVIYKTEFVNFLIKKYNCFFVFLTMDVNILMWFLPFYSSCH